jgi:hypothetical protein
MPAAAAVTINDGQATPVAVTFSPEVITSDVASFADRTPGVAVAYRRITVSNKFARGASKVNRAKYTVDYPVTTTVNGITTVAYTLRATVDLILPDQATTAERNNLFAFVSNGINNTAIRSSLRDLDPQY